MAMLFAELPMDSYAILLIDTYIYTPCYTLESEGIHHLACTMAAVHGIFSFCTELPPTYIFTLLTKEGESVIDMIYIYINVYETNIFIHTTFLKYKYMFPIVSLDLHDTGLWPFEAGNLDDFTIFKVSRCLQV